MKYCLLFVILTLSLSSSADELITVASKQEQQPVKDSWTDKVQEVLMHAFSLTDINYRYGGNTPETGFDCSGFVRYVFSQATPINLPRTARAISQRGQSIHKSELQPGDLVFFNTIRRSISHVGIYVGNNKFIHAPSKGKQIRLDKLNNRYWAKHFRFAKRLKSEL